MHFGVGLAVGNYKVVLVQNVSAECISAQPFFFLGAKTSTLGLRKFTFFFLLTRARARSKFSAVESSNSVTKVEFPLRDKLTKVILVREKAKTILRENRKYKNRHEALTNLQTNSFISKDKRTRYLTNTGDSFWSFFWLLSTDCVLTTGKRREL